MKNKYLKYQVEDFLADENFVNSIKNPEHSELWANWLTENPSIQTTVDEATQLLESFQFKKETFTNQSAVWQRIEQSTSAKEIALKPKKSSRLVWAITAIAASVTLLFFVLNTQSNEFTIDNTQGLAVNQTIELPSGSIVTLHGQSTIDYNTGAWDQERRIKLSGSATFDVAKGVPFIIESANGTVQVLGTKFTITDESDSYIVDVERGKVKVSSGNKSQILTANMSYRKNAPNTAATSAEAIIFFQFENKRLTEVLASIENSFGVSVQVDEKLIIDKNYTGLYSNENIREALQSVLWPMNLGYQIDGKKVIISKEK